VLNIAIAAVRFGGMKSTISGVLKQACRDAANWPAKTSRHYRERQHRIAELRRREVHGDDKNKIDRSFIRELGKANDCMAIIRAVMRLGSSLGMISTAEGVETEEQLEILRAEGCMQVQGFLFSKAVPASEIPPLLGRLQPRIEAA